MTEQERRLRLIASSSIVGGDVRWAINKLDSLRHHVKALQMLCKAQHAPIDYDAWCAEVDAIDATLNRG